MKKLLLRIPLLLAAMFLTSIPLSAYDFEVDGIYYERTTVGAFETVSVTHNGNRNCYSGEIVIPETVTNPEFGTCSVKAISKAAFSGCVQLTSIVIPKSVTSIEDAAFYDCNSLRALYIEDGNYNISMGKNDYQQGLFFDCPLDSIYLGRNVSFDINPFDNIHTLKHVTIGSLVSSISENFGYIPIFTHCSNLESITVDSDNEIYDSRDNCNAVIESATNTLVAACKTTTIPNSVTSIGSFAFYDCTGLTSITIPNSVTSIEGYAFSGCTGLTSITIPNSVTSIGYDAFQNCTGLTSVTIPNSVTEIRQSAFQNCTGLTSVTIPNSVTSIEGSAFSGCTGLTSITIPNSVTLIEGSAFSGCTGLTSVTICDSPNTLDFTNGRSNYLSPNPFPYVINLYLGRNININNTDIYSYDNKGFFNNVSSVVIGAQVSSIPKYTFNMSTNLKELYIQDSSESLTIETSGNSSYGKSGHFHNSPLEKIYLGRNVTWSSKDSPFYNIKTITQITIGDSVTTIDDKIFYSCSRLAAVTIPEGIEYIGERAFNEGVDTLYFNAKKCVTTTKYLQKYSPFSGIKCLKIGDSVKCISEYIFMEALSMETITIPNTVTKIEYYAFARNGIRTIKIPTSITEIDSDAFYGCYSLVKTSFSTSHTTFTLSSLTTPTEYTPYCYNHYNQKYMNAGEKITGLAPSTSLGIARGLIINGTYCRTDYSSISTNSFSVNLKGDATVTTLSATGSHSNGDFTFVGEGINLSKEVTNFDNNNDSIFENLDPNTTYTVYYGVKIKEISSAYTTSKTFTTGALEWSEGEYQATSTTSVRLMTETTCDATAGTGIEWRRYGAPESLAPNKAECPVVDGMLVGFLKGLNPEAYYEYRPYYTSASGKTYYGEWAAFFSGDAGVYFEPEVRTFTESSVDGNSATIKGYALPGTDEVTGQGFEYWKTSGISTYSTDNIKTVLASGISMSATLSGLDYNSTYCYRAFVTTAKGTTYGDTVEFSTGYPAGIYTVDADNDKNTASYRILPGMLVVNGDDRTPVMVADMNGRVLFSGCAAGQLELPLKAGIYILRLGNNAHKVAIR